MISVLRVSTGLNPDQNHFSVGSDGLDPDQNHFSVGPDIGPTCLQRLSTEEKCCG